MTGTLPVQWLGRLEYRWALGLQRARRLAILEGRAPDVLWTLEHPPVVTLGRRGGELRACPRGVPVVAVERGGLATVHAPGQLVGYLLADLGARRIAVRHAVWALEQGVIDWLGDRGVEAARRAGAPGVWVGDAKIAAVGLHVRRGVSMHGFALNLDPDLAVFDWVVPCGLHGVGVTSLARLRGQAPSVEAASDGVGSRVVARLVDSPEAYR